MFDKKFNTILTELKRRWFAGWWLGRLGNHSTRVRHVSARLLIEIKPKKTEQAPATAVKQCMFEFLKKDPLKKLEQQRGKLLEEAMRIQRSGDLRLYTVKMAAIDQLEKTIENLEKGKR